MPDPLSPRESEAMGGHMDDRFGLSHLAVPEEEAYEAGWLAARSFYTVVSDEQVEKAARAMYGMPPGGSWETQEDRAYWTNLARKALTVYNRKEGEC